MRLSEAEFKRLGRNTDGTRKAKAKAGTADGGAEGKPKPKGRSRHARIPYPDVVPVSFSVDLPYDPRPKERPRTAVNKEALKAAFLKSRGNLGDFMKFATGLTNTYTPKRTLDYENLIKPEARIAMLGRRPIDVPVDADIYLVLDGDPETWPTSSLDGDGDNLQKAVLDALNEIVFTDDRLIVRKSVIKECGPKPKLRIEVRGADPTRGPASPVF